MDFSEKVKLKRLYEFVENSPSSIAFYNASYDYILYVKENRFLKNLIELDDVEWSLRDKNKLERLLPKYCNESSDKYASNSAMYMSSGDDNFLNFYLNKIDQYIFNPIHWHRTDGFLDEGLETILKAEKNKYYDFYVTDISKFRELLKDFHILLLKRIEETPKIEILFSLEKDGAFKYKNISSNLSVSSKEFKILDILYRNKNKVVKYNDIFEKVYRKNDSKANRLDLTNDIKNLKIKLGILPKTENSLPDLIANHKNIGYSLDLSKPE